MIDVTDATFEQAVLERSKQVPVVVDLWAPWCGPCRTLGPIIEKVVGATEGSVDLVKVNVDDSPDVARRFEIMSIPTLMLFKDGVAKKRLIGAKGKQQLLRELEEFL